MRTYSNYPILFDECILLIITYLLGPSPQQRPLPDLSIIVSVLISGRANTSIRLSLAETLVNKSDPRISRDL
jgi:hypothetical protein